MKTIKLAIMVIMITGFSYAQLPESKQATLVESVSSSEVMIEATGIYSGVGGSDRRKKDDVEENGVARATLDARKAAVYFVLFGGTDPLISTPQERQKFDVQLTYFFNEKVVGSYISYEDLQVIKKIKIDEGRGLKIVKRFKVNKEIMIKDLEARQILEARSDLAESLGNPFIMVLPAVQKGENPIEKLTTDPILKHAASVVESYLTARQYEVVVPEQQAALEGLSSAQMDLENRDEDYAYKLALSIGSDVYITFSGILEDAGYGTKKYTMNVRAYETTTARLLGTETGYSQGRRGEVTVSVEEAMNDAIDKVLNRINNYWKKDLKDGVQYKLIISLSSNLSEDDVEDIKFALMDVMENVAKKSKENISTKQTLDYLIWCNPEKFNKSSNIYRALKKHFKDEKTPGVLKDINVNRKMILLKVDPE